MTTMKDIAEELGVSRSTVSVILNGKSSAVRISEHTRKRVLDTVERLGYQRNELAYSMVRGKTNFIACMVWEISKEYQSRTLAGILQESQEKGFFVKFMQMSPADDFSASIKKILGQQPAGLICKAKNQEDYALAFEECKKQNIPFAAHGDFLAHPFGISVDTDDLKGAKNAVSYLAKLGHKKIACISGWLSSSYSKLRYEGYTSAMKMFNLNISDDYLVFTDNPVEIRCKLSAMLSRANRPTAFFCASDYFGIEVIREARKLGLSAPNDISVVGFGGMHVAELCDPPLTTVEEPFEKCGRTVSSLLISEIQNSNKISFNKRISRLLPVKLVIRESTAKPKGAK